MCAGDGDCVGVTVHNHAEHHGTLNTGNAFFCSGYAFRVICTYGSGVNHQFGIADIFLFLPHKDRNTIGTDSFKRVGFIPV